MDNILTTQIQQFLQLEKPTEEQIREGATLLLRCNPQRERAIYNSAMTRPKSMLPWIKADLKKYLGIRQRGLTTPQVEKFNQETIAAVKQTLSNVPVTVEQDSGETPLIPQLGIRGLRPDHDQLPENIQALFSRNTERWKSMRKLHTQLAQMIARPGYAACDGNEICYQLRQLDTALRNDYEAYDSFVIDDKKPSASADRVDVFTDNVKTIQTARAAVSRGIARKTPHTKESFEKLENAVKALVALKQKLKPATVEKLAAIGITIPRK